ncbi:MAG: DUF998 domain-containing protein [Stackebrandtia sp.]
MNTPTSPLRSAWTTRDTAGHHHVPWYARLAVIAGLVTIVTFVALHVMEAETISVFKDPVSTYVLTDVGAKLFALGSLGLAGSCVAVLFGPLGSEAVPRWALGGAVVFLLLVVGFDTDAGATVSTVGGYVHRYAAGAVFVLITVAVIHTWRRQRGTAYGRVMGVILFANLVLLVVNWSGTYQPHILDGGQWRGIPQRLLLVILVAAIVLMAFTPRRPVTPRRPAAPHSTPPGRGMTRGARSETTENVPDEKVWLSGRGTTGRGALPSADGL